MEGYGSAQPAVAALGRDVHVLFRAAVFSRTTTSATPVTITERRPREPPSCLK
jgi:hypothetical protein